MQCVFEEAGDEIAVGMHLHTIPARVGDHDRADAFVDCVVVGRHVNAHQVILAGQCVVLVDASRGSSVADVVLRTSHNILSAEHMDNSATVKVKTLHDFDFLQQS